MLEPKLYMSDHWIVSDNDGMFMWIDDPRSPLQQYCFSTESNGENEYKRFLWNYIIEPIYALTIIGLFLSQLSSSDQKPLMTAITGQI